MSSIKHYDQFMNRHIGPRKKDIELMLDEIGVDSLDGLINKTIPEEIRLREPIKISEAMDENNFLRHIRELASKNRVVKDYIGLGYYPTKTPSVIIRNILENPGWYTQYTPYQAEISQGRLEALLNFQTMVSDLTALPLANASLLDEATAAAEAMLMFWNLRRGAKKNAGKFLVSKDVFPQTLGVILNRAEPRNIDVAIDDLSEELLTEDVFALLIQNPDSNGEIKNYKSLIESASSRGIKVIVAADLLSLALVTPPGEMGADAAVGTTQRFGVPIGFGGPHAAYFAVKEEFKRSIPGRIIGVSIDRNGKTALRMALQTREQHIKRERATSNICTAQVLLAIMSGMYAVYHGSDGVRKIAGYINKLTLKLNSSIKSLGYEQINKFYFDTLKIKVTAEQSEIIKKKALEKDYNFRYFDSGFVGISVNEETNEDNINEIAAIFAEASGGEIIAGKEVSSIPDELSRESEYLTHPVFNSYHSETEMMRYIKKLENRDLSLMHSMISLGSCTMKLNAASEMFPISWPEFGNIHPFAPKEQTEGYAELIDALEKDLAAITGFKAVSFQPNSGAQGEYAGLMVIREYHKSRGEENRNIVLIPSSAHGTNPASAVMAGSKVIVISCDGNGNIDLNDLKAKAEENKNNLSALMVTYPSTHGVFEEGIIKICSVIHEYGGQVYMDGANMNAQVGLTSPANIGADVCHLNLHKTFAIPHGGGGPGVGPIAVAGHLVPFLPKHPFVNPESDTAINPVSAAPFGSASILPISYGYIKMSGEEGLRKSAQIAILNANYLRIKLGDYYKVLYTGSKGFSAHELIFDLREFKLSANVEAGDVAKRLMDYGFHAPTVSFPVHGTLMVEPTESESKEELDKFIKAMRLIRAEIDEISQGRMDREDNPIKNAPHTVDDVVSSEWSHSYSREKAVYPAPWCRENKFWPYVARVDDAYGDRNLFCSCMPIKEYAD